MTKKYPDIIYFVFFFPDGNREVYERTGLRFKVIYSRQYDDGCLEFVSFYGRIRGKQFVGCCPLNRKQLTSENVTIRYFEGSEDVKVLDLLEFLRGRQRFGRINLSDRFVRNLQKKKPWAFTRSEGPVDRSTQVPFKARSLYLNEKKMISHSEYENLSYTRERIFQSFQHKLLEEDREARRILEDTYDFFKESGLTIGDDKTTLRYRIGDFKFVIKGYVSLKQRGEIIMKTYNELELLDGKKEYKLIETLTSSYRHEKFYISGIEQGEHSEWSYLGTYSERLIAYIEEYEF